MKIINLSCIKDEAIIPNDLDSTLETCIIKTLEADNYSVIRNFLYKKYGDTQWKQNTENLIDSVPIYIVDTLQEDTDVSFDDKTIHIPKRNTNPFGGTSDEETEFEESWFDFMRRMIREAIKQGKKSLSNHTVLNNDTLGQYQYDHEIFIWIDTILEISADISYDYPQYNFTDKKFIQVLLQQCILHEVGHAIMDVSLYDNAFLNITAYRKKRDNPYPFIEEANANAFAIKTGEDNLWDSNQSKFIEIFVKNYQIDGYFHGWNLHTQTFFFQELKSWMKIKILLNEETIDIVESFYKNRHNPNFKDLIIDPLSELFYIPGIEKISNKPQGDFLWEKCENVCYAFTELDLSNDADRKWGLLFENGKKTQMEFIEGEIVESNKIKIKNLADKYIYFDNLGNEVTP